MQAQGINISQLSKCGGRCLPTASWPKMVPCPCANGSPNTTNPTDKLTARFLDPATLDTLWLVRIK